MCENEKINCKGFQCKLFIFMERGTYKPLLISNVGLKWQYSVNLSSSRVIHISVSEPLKRA